MKFKNGWVMFIVKIFLFVLIVLVNSFIKRFVLVLMLVMWFLGLRVSVVII